MLFELCFLLLERYICFFVIWGKFTCVWKRLFEEMCFIREVRFDNMDLFTILRLVLFTGVFGLKTKKLELWVELLSFPLLSEESEEFFLKIHALFCLFDDKLFGSSSIGSICWTLIIRNCGLRIVGLISSLKFVLLSVLLSLFIFLEVVSFIFTFSLIDELIIGDLSSVCFVESSFIFLIGLVDKI
jgi:hypothetical protein